MGARLRDFELANLGHLPDGRPFEWELTGDGEPMLWIEGGPGLPAHLARPDVALFARYFKGHLVNAPGCGRTSPPPTRDGYSLVNHVEFFDQVRVALGLGRITVVGHSWGGLVAMAFAALKPHAIRRLIVLEGYAGGGSVPAEAAEAEREKALDRVRDRPWFPDAAAALEAWDALSDASEQQVVAAAAGAWPVYFADPMLPRNRPHVERLGRDLRYNPVVEAVWYGRHEAADHRDLAQRVTCPCLVVVGEHDFICGPVWAHALADAIPHVRLVQMPNVGHFPQYEDPETLMKAVGSWLADAESGTT